MEIESVAGEDIRLPEIRRRMPFRWPTRLALHSCVQLSMVMVMVMAAAQLFTITAAYSCGQWPRHNYNDTCEMKQCQPNPNDSAVFIYDPPHQNCTGVAPLPSYSIYTLAMMTDCPNATAPGKPNDLKVQVSHNPTSGFLFAIKWKYTDVSANLAGFQVKLSDSDVYHVSLRKFLESGLSNGSYQVTFTNKPDQRRLYMNTPPVGVFITPKIFDNCFIRPDRTKTYSVAVTSLPLASSLRDSRDKQTAKTYQTVNTCADYSCHDTYDRSSLCPDKYILRPTEIVPVCKCFGLILDITGMYQVDNTTVAFSLKWAPWSTAEDRDTFWLSIWLGSRESDGTCGNTKPAEQNSMPDKFLPHSRDTFEVSSDRDVNCAYAKFTYNDNICEVQGSVPPKRFFVDKPTVPTTMTTKHRPTMLSSSTDTEATAEPADAQSGDLSIAVGVAMGGLVLVMLGLGLILYWNFKYKPDSKEKSEYKKRDKYGGAKTRPSTTESDGTACTVYISYSRFTATCRQQARQLRNALVESHVNAVLDADHIHQHAMADNREAWLDDQMLSADYVIVLLDERYPLNLDMTEDTLEAMLSADFDDSFKFTMSEVKRLQAVEYWGRPDFIVPVYIGAATSLQSIVPMMLRMKTVHRLPSDFDVSSPRFRQLAYRLLCHHGTHQIYRMSESSV